MTSICHLAAPILELSTPAPKPPIGSLGTSGYFLDAVTLNPGKSRVGHSVRFIKATTKRLQQLLGGCTGHNWIDFFSANASDYKLQPICCPSDPGKNGRISKAAAILVGRNWGNQELNPQPAG